MTHLKIREEIFIKFAMLYDFSEFSDKERQPCYSKLMNFKKKLAQLSLEELQDIQKKLKNFNWWVIPKENHQENVQNLRRLKKYIQDDPRNQYKHLIPALNLFLIEDLHTVNPYDHKISYLIRTYRTILADGDMNNPGVFCRSFEEKLCLLYEAGGIAYMQACTKNDTLYLRLVMLLCIIIVTVCYILLLSIAISELDIFIYVLSISLAAVCFNIYLLLSEIYEHIDFKITLGKLSDSLLKIRFDEQVSKWALMSLEKENKLPKDVVAHIGSFFPNHKDLEKRLYPKKTNAPIPEHKGLTSQPVMIN